MTDQLTVDLSGYKDKVGARVVPGRYHVAVVDAEFGKTKNNDDKLEVWLRVVEGAQEGEEILDRYTFGESALFRFVGFMQAVGLPTPRKRILVQTKQVIGRHLVVDVEDGDPYMGRIKSEVRGYFAHEGGNRETTDISDIATGEAATEAALPGSSDMGVFEGDPEIAAANRERPPVRVPDQPEEYVDLENLDL